MHMHMFTVYQRTLHGKTLRTVPEIGVGVWVHLEKPTEEEMEKAATELSVNIDLIKDALDPYEVPRFEMDEGVAYIFLRYPAATDQEGTMPFLIAVAEKGVLTVSQEKAPFLERLTAGTIEFYTTQKTKLVLILIAEITARYTAGLTAIQRAVNRKKQRVDKMTEADILEFSAAEIATNDYLDALLPQGNALAKLSTGKTLVVFEEDRDLIDDLILSTSQLIDIGRSAMKTMENTREAYTAISAQRLNQVIKRLTALTILVTVPNVITGFYGMNLLLPGADNPFAAWLVIAATMSVVLGICLFLWWKKWL